MESIECCVNQPPPSSMTATGSGDDEEKQKSVRNQNVSVLSVNA